MMRLYRRRSQRRTPDIWDDAGTDDFADAIARLARAADAPADDHAAGASRRAALEAFRQASASGLRRAPTPVPLIRRPFVMSAAAAAALTIAMIGGWSASSAGGPLYMARVAAEELALPRSATARERAQTDRLAARVVEVNLAATSGDQGGVQASLEAFVQIAEAAAVDAVPDPDAAERLAGQLALLAEIPVSGVEMTALRDRAARAGASLWRVMLGGGPGSGPGAGGPGQVPPLTPGATPGGWPAIASGSPGGQGGSGAQPQATGAGRPASSPPVGSAGPAPTGSPVASPTPGSSAPAPTAGPGGSGGPAASRGPGNGSGSPSPSGSGGPGGSGKGGPGG